MSRNFTDTTYDVVVETPRLTSRRRRTVSPRFLQQLRPLLSMCECFLLQTVAGVSLLTDAHGTLARMIQAYQLPELSLPVEQCSHIRHLLLRTGGVFVSTLFSGSIAGGDGVGACSKLLSPSNTQHNNTTNHQQKMSNGRIQHHQATHHNTAPTTPRPPTSRV